MSDISVTDSFLNTLLTLASEDNDVNSVVTLAVDCDSSNSSDLCIEEHFDTSDETALNGRNKIGRAILTFFPPNNHRNWLLPETFFPHVKESFSIWVAQFENCPETGKLHVHVYVEFKNTHRMRFNTVRDHFGKHGLVVSIRLAKKANAKQRQGGVNYCSHPDKRAPDCEPVEAYFWPDNNPQVTFDPTMVSDKKRKRDGIEEMRQYIETKPIFWTWDQIVHECDFSKKLLATCSWGPKYHAGRYAEIGRREIKEVIIMYGAGGTGKTTMCMNHNTAIDPNKETRYYRRNPDDGVFWGGGRTAYKGQSVLHFEEFTGQEMFSRLKEVCDIGKPGPAVNVKNGGIDLNHDTVIFTSNVHPAGWYHKLWTNDPKQFHPFWRRVTKVLFFPSHKDDGSLNVPTDEIQPFFLDQTEEWHAFHGDYNDAIKHADKHWPLKMVEPLGEQMVGNGTGPGIRWC